MTLQDIIDLTMVHIYDSVSTGRLITALAKDKRTGEIVPILAVIGDPDINGNAKINPLAKMFTYDPSEELDLPTLVRVPTPQAQPSTKLH